MSVRFRAMAADEVDRGGLDPSAIYAVAEDAGQVVSFFVFDLGTHQQPCPTCVGRCGKTRRLWTIPERRNQGIFKALYSWAQRAYQMDTVYEVGGSPADIAVIRWKYDIRASPGAQVIDYSRAEESALEMLAAIEKGIG